MKELELKTCIEKGLTLKQIALELNCSKTNIRYWIKKFNLKLKRRDEKPKDFNVHRKCSCGESNPDLF